LIQGFVSPTAVVGEMRIVEHARMVGGVAEKQVRAELDFFANRTAY
jgi:hypothetical protein